MEFSIENQTMRISATEDGAELQRVTVDSTERLWQNENGGWAGHAPVLFPFCGSCDMNLDGVSYGSGFHGFASGKKFTCISHTESAMTFRLTDDADTREVYPFRFVLDITYSVDARKTLTITWDITNRSDCTMPFACGGHESYLLRSKVDDYKLVFPNEEHLEYHIHNANGRMSGEKDDRGVGTELRLSSADLANGNTVILNNLRSRSVLLVDGFGNAVAESVFPNFPNLLLWHPDGSDMICIEPWQNLPDDACGCPDFSEKPGVLHLAPNQSCRIVRQIRYF